MLKGLLNGQTFLALGAGDRLQVVEVDPPSVGINHWSFELTRSRDHGTLAVWSRRWEAMAGDPTSAFNRSTTVDYCATYWRRHDLVAIAGNAKAIIVSGANGDLLSYYSLWFTEPSLDVLKIVESPDWSHLAVISTRRVIGLDSTGHAVWQWDAEGFLKPEIDVSGDSILLREVETHHPRLPVAERRLTFQTGLCS